MRFETMVPGPLAGVPEDRCPLPVSASRWLDAAFH